MAEKETIKFVPHPDILLMYKKIVIAFFLILGFLPILFVLYVSVVYGILHLTIFEIAEMVFGYIVYSIGCIKAIDILIKGYKIVYFHPKILTMNLIFEIILVIPLFLIFFGIWNLSLFFPQDIAMFVFMSSFILVLIYTFALFFVGNVFHFLSTYANLLYLSDYLKGKLSKSTEYVRLSLSELGTSIKYAVAKEVIHFPAAMVGALGLRRMEIAISTMLEITTVFTVPIIILEKLGVKKAFQESVKIVVKNSKKIPEIFFLLSGPELLATFIAFVILGTSMFVGVSIIDARIREIMSEDVLGFGFGSFVFFSNIFLIYIIPPTFFVLYYATVVLSSKKMAIILFYFKLKGYPVDIETIKKYKI